MPYQVIFCAKKEKMCPKQEKNRLLNFLGAKENQRWENLDNEVVRLNSLRTYQQAKGQNLYFFMPPTFFPTVVAKKYTFAAIIFFFLSKIYA